MPVPTEGMGVLHPDWPLPQGVHSLCYASVAEAVPGTGILSELPTPLWLPHQHHGTQLARLSPPLSTRPEGDIVYTRAKGLACAVVAADCLPLLLCERGGREVAAVHAGWRGLAAGALACGVDAFTAPATQLIAWIGPAIGAAHYPVGEEVRRALAPLAGDGDFFKPLANGRWQLDLSALASNWLRQRGLAAVYNSGICCWT